ncbi:tetratricopeptide repeat protein [Runella sp.]|uniref:tetratricopeptide repeat protein n=1 Tax=Runella sp. TaxID=1960881 RepID=UPI003D0CA0C0
MTNLERIENYYTNALSGAERADFEAELKSNPALAEDVAFYVQARAAAQAEARARRLQELTNLGQKTSPTRIRTVNFPWTAAAAVVLLLSFGTYWWFSAAPVQQETATAEWATHYIENNFDTLSVTMSGRGDSLQTGINLYNSGKYAEAQQVFETLLQRDSINAEAEKLAGIVSLQRGNYDQAIKHFHRLGNRTDLRSNPGKFYEAIALLKKNVPLDNYQAKKLLKEVKEGKLEGWKEVE